MKQTSAILAALAILLLANTHGLAFANRDNNGVPASGEVVEGLRILTVEAGSRSNRLTVFRGDYIKFRVEAAREQPVLSIPSLAIEQQLPADPEEAPYFKMKKTGSFLFTLGEAAGLLEVVEYTQPNYRLVSVEEAAALIRNVRPVVLDVRTPGEYGQGHIEGAVLVPVQALRRRVGELSRYKNEDILIYCATGNRSTVAAKILIDGGFRRVFNMRKGFLQWARDRLPVVRP